MFFKKDSQNEHSQQSGDAFTLSVEETMHHFGDTVYRIALKMVKHEADAQDVFQDVFMRYIKYAKNLTSLDHVKHWLIRTTINRCKDFFEDEKRQAHLMEAHSEKLKTAAPKDPYSVREAVQELDKKYRIVVHLFYFEGYKIREIAELLDEPENTIKSKLNRARHLLKEKIQDE